jgi:1,4-alpha-glucan branching enzyme
MAIFNAIKKSNEPMSKLQNAGAMQEVEFALNAPEAHEVHLAGSFNDWNTSSLPLKKDRDGMWKVKVKLPRGRHEYKYFTDGKWSQNMQCATVAPNTFGTSNCVVAVA